MSTARYLGLCSLVLAGSFAGSLMANWGMASVHAQAPETGDLRARSVTIVDAKPPPLIPPPGRVSNDFWYPSRKDLGPRIGFAWIPASNENR